MRHSVELQLKGAIQQLQKIAEIRGEGFEFDLSGSHDIGRIWHFFRTKSQSVDARYTALNERIETHILDIAEVDPTGQTFRYPIDTQSQKHLTKVSVISFYHLKVQFSILRDNLTTLYRLNEYLVDEYLTGTFTRNLSRLELFNLAQNLPNRETWRNSSFNTKKKELKQAFSLSSRELSFAIKLIENHYEFSSLIGMQQPLRGVSNDVVAEFFSQWIRVHEVPFDSSVTDPESRSMSDVVDDWFKKFEGSEPIYTTEEAIWDEMSPLISPAVIAGLNALFYFSYELDFSERYIIIYENQLKSASSELLQSKEQFKGRFYSLLSKTNAMHNIVKSLCFLNQNQLIEELVASYELDTKFSWLCEARSRFLFKKPDYCRGMANQVIQTFVY